MAGLKWDGEHWDEVSVQDLEYLERYSVYNLEASQEV